MEPFDTRANVTCIDVSGGSSLSVYSKTESEAGRTPTQRPSLKLNAISNWVPLGVNFIIGLVLTPLLIGHLGKEGFGIWKVVASFIGYYGLLRLGVGSGIMRYVPFYKGTSDDSATSQVVSTGMAIFLIVGSAILLISMLLAEPISRFYKGGAELASLVRILGVAAALACPMRILDACIRSHEHWIAANFATIFIAIARALGLVGCVYFGYGVVEMGYVVLAVTIFSVVLMTILFIRLCPTIRLQASIIKLSHVRTLLSFGILTTIVGLIYTLTLQGHSLIIGKLMSLEAVAIYAVPALLIRNIRQGLLAPVRVLWPRFAYLDGKNRFDEVASLFLRGTRFTAIFASGVMLIVFVLGPSFIGLWMEGDFTAAYPVLLLLAGGYLVEGSQAIVPFLLGGIGRQGTQAILAALEGVIGIPLSIILTWKIGIVGAPISFLIAIALVRGLLSPWYVCHLLGTSLLRYYTGKLLRPWLVLGALTLTAYVLGIPELIDGWLALVCAAMAVVILYVLCTYLFVMTSDERTKLKVYLKQRSKQLNIGTDPVE